MILIVGPNIGAFLGSGGGSRVALNMAEILAEAGYDVRLVAAEGLPVEALDALHGTNLRQFIENGSLKLWYFLGDNLPHVPFPIKVRLLSAYLSQKIAGGQVDLLIFHDDVPKPLASRQWPARVLLYSHFPYMARLSFNFSDPFEVDTRLRMFKERVIRTTMRRTIFVEERPRATLVANSSITKGFMEKIWGPGIGVLYPAVSLPSEEVRLESKEDLVTVVSAIQPNKRLSEIISALALTRDVKLCVIGRVQYEWYYDFIINKIAKLNLGNRVNVLTNVNDAEKIKILKKSKIIISAAHFEPFGMAVVEGMHSGCVPLVYEGELSGPWIDICCRGDYGIGFKDEEGLALQINQVMNNDQIFKKYASSAILRSQTFSYEKFKKRWLFLISHLIAQ